MKLLIDCFEFLRYRHLKGFGQEYPIENSKRIFFYGYFGLYYFGTFYFLLEWAEKFGFKIEFNLKSKLILILYFVIFVGIISSILKLLMYSYFKNYNIKVNDKIENINNKKYKTIIVAIVSLVYFIFSIMSITPNK